MFISFVITIEQKIGVFEFKNLKWALLGETQQFIVKTFQWLNVYIMWFNALDFSLTELD